MHLINVTQAQGIYIDVVCMGWSMYVKLLAGFMMGT